MLLSTCVHIRPQDRSSAIIRANLAPGFKALIDNQFLIHHTITLEVGNAKISNKNPVAERAVQEVESDKLLPRDLLFGPACPLALAIATAVVNVCIPLRGLSAREMWTQCDQFSNQQLPLQDQDIILRILRQQEQHKANHPKALVARRHLAECIAVDNLGYLYFSLLQQDQNLGLLLVVEVSGSFCNIRKFVGTQFHRTV